MNASSPAARTASSLAATGADTVTGATTRPMNASVSRAAFAANTRHSSGAVDRRVAHR